MSCKKLIINEFENTILSGMASAEILKTKESLKKYSIKTIKSNLCVLKKEKLLTIGFRRNGKFSEIGLDGKRGYKKGVCYYKLK